MIVWADRILVAAGATLVACKAGKPTDNRPLKEAIVGAWDVWCATDDEAKASCLGKDDAKLVKTFKADGTVELSVDGRGDSPMIGKWTVKGSELELAFEGINVERYRARIEDGHLVLWYPSGPFGSVLGRHGEAFSADPGHVSSGGSETGTLGGVHYAIDLPAGYRLARDDNQRQRWAPANGEGFVIDLVVSPRPQEIIDGRPVTHPCDRDSGTGGSSETIDGKERDIDVFVNICLRSSEDSLMCSAGHSRGYLEASEKPAALALCKSLVVR